MITAQQAFKETNEYINDPKLSEDLLYNKFIRELEFSGFRNYLNGMIKEQIQNRKLSLSINLKNGRDASGDEREFIWKWQKIDQLYSFTKYLNKLGYKEDFDFSRGDIKYLNISWAEANT